MEITSMSSRGQVVIPLDIRQSMNLAEGEKFVVSARGSTLLLRKLEKKDFEAEFDKVMKESQEFARKNKITPKDLDEAIKKARSKGNESSFRH